jgi:SET domain
MDGDDYHIRTIYTIKLMQANTMRFFAPSSSSAAAAAVTVVLALVLSAIRDGHSFDTTRTATISSRRRRPTTKCRTSCSSLSLSLSFDSNEDGVGEKYNRLLDWIQQQEGSFISPSIEIKPSSLVGGGYGAFCQEPVAQDELLFAIPRRACITLADALADADCGAVFQKVMEKAGPGGNTVVMAGFMAKERLQSLGHHHHHQARMMAATKDADADAEEASISPPLVVPDDSRFGPYLATLPWERGVNNQEHALFWTNDDVETYLTGTMCHDEVQELRNEVELAISVLDKIMSKSIRKMRNHGVGDVSENKNGFFKWPWETAQMTAAELDKEQGPVAGLPEAIKGAFVSLLTRSFQDDTDGNSAISSNNENDEGSNGEEKMVPLLDLLQHGNDPNVRHAMRLADGTVEVRARRDLRAGEELLNQYRAETEVTMPFHRFFTRYGFVPGIQEPMLNLLLDRSPIFFAQKAEV